MNSSTSSSEGARRFVASWVCAALAPLVLYFAATEALIRTRIEPFDLASRQRAFFFSAGRHAASAIFGDSHASRGFTGVDGFVNLASPGEALARTRQKLALFDPPGGRGRVILQIGPHIFAAYRQQQVTTPWRQPAWWSPRMREDEHRRKWFRYWGVALDGRSFTPKMVLQPDGARTRREGMPGGGDDVAQLAAGRVREHLPHADPASTRSARELEEILGDLAERDLEVCLASFPVSPEYAREAARHPEFERAIAFLGDLARRHGVRYVDLRAVFDDAALFFNPDHLTLEGARRFAPTCVKACFGDSGSG